MGIYASYIAWSERVEKKQQLVNLRLLFRRQAFVCHMSVESFGWMHDSEHTISGSSGRLSDTSQQNRTRPMLRHTATFFFNSCWSQSQTRQPNIILPPRATFPWSCQCFTLTQLHSHRLYSYKCTLTTVSHSTWIWQFMHDELNWEVYKICRVNWSSRETSNA